MTDKNDDIINDIIDDLLEDIQESFLGSGKLITFIESIGKGADQYLKTVDTTSILKSVDWIKSADPQSLIGLLSSNTQFKSSNEEEMIKHIQIIKGLDFKDLSKISFMEEDQVIAAFLHLIIRCFKKDLKKKKFPCMTKKEIFIYLYVNEIKSIVNELKPLLLNGDNFPVNYEVMFEISTIMHRLGYLSGLLDAEKKFKSYHHSLKSKGHYVAGKGKHDDIEKKYREDIRSIIQEHVKELYNQGCSKWHYEVADELREPIVKYLKDKKSGKSTNESTLNQLYQKIIAVLKNYQTSNNKNWLDLYNVLKKKSKKDFFCEAVSSVCPEKHIRGIKNVSTCVEHIPSLVDIK